MKEYALLNQYLKEIGRYPRLSVDEEMELARRVREGDAVAKKRLIESNLRLVVKVAMDMYRGKMSIMDIIQNGNLGLIRAAEKFDPQYNIRFSSYAVYWIKQSILRHFQEDGYLENISVRLQDKKRRMRQFIEEFFIRESRFPSVQELADAFSLSFFEAAQELKQYFPQIVEKPTVSLEEIADTKSIEDVICEKFLSKDLAYIMEQLDEESQALLKLRYGFEQEKCATLYDLAQYFHLSVEGIRQRENRLLAFIGRQCPSLKYYLA